MIMSERLVIIPTYNERENIEKMIHTVFSLDIPFDILVVDDGSPDGTATIVKKLQNQYSGNLHLVERSGKLGLGTAYVHGFKWALDRGFEFIFEMDCDFSHDPKDLVRLYEACIDEKADLVIGSRYKSGVNVVNWPMGRVLMSYYASVYVRFITGMNIRDTTAGFKCYRAEVLRKIDIDNISFKGYAFQIEMKFRTWRKGFKIFEVPIIFTDRREGVSKMSGGIFKEAVFGVIQLKLKSIFGKI
ncbi:MAG TPA: dolichyl-phosphate beta-D-mannosyltransferase [Flavobacteriales bacterium]|nr:dolichyl-phosphate beta-D-mannosyltransferase [Flavobacteriales bacterium]